jgi:hypothetical protein
MIIRVLAAAILGLVGFAAQMTAAQPAPSARPLTASELDRLVAPIALYPDPLLAQILMAATYPLEVVEADRWLQVPANAVLTGDALTAALQRQKWDASIESLIAFPRVLGMMDDHLEWTEQLGNAFLMQQADVMGAIQRLRRLAGAAGSLASGPQQTVSPPEPEVAIEPTNPGIVYVPGYNPWCVYGAWPDPAYPPFVFGTFADSCGPEGLVFGVGISPRFGFWAWGVFAWRRHEIRINRTRFAQFHVGQAPADSVWQHNPAHRDGVAYPNWATAARFLGAAAAAPHEFSGFAPEPAETRAGLAARSTGRASLPTVIRGGIAGEPRLPPTSELPPAPMLRSFGAGTVARGGSTGGFSSRLSAAAPSFRPTPAPSFHAAPRLSFHSAPSGGANMRR